MIYGRYWVLRGHEPVRATLMEWGEFFQTANRRVRESWFGPDKSVHVSTVFLGLDHNWDVGPPHLFETMIFGGEHANYCTRCATWDEAEKMHTQACRLVAPTQLKLIAGGRDG